MDHHSTSDPEMFVSSMRKKVKQLESVLESTRKRIPFFRKQKWTHSKTIDGLKILKSAGPCVEGSQISCVRAIHSLPFRTTRKPWEILKHVMQYYIDERLTKRYLPILHPYFPYYTSYHIQDEIYALHCRFSSGTFIVKDRDYLNVRNLYKDEDGGVCTFLSCSIPEDLTEEDWPRDKACIRGKLTIYMCTIRSVGDERVEFEYLSHGDPNGMIPAWKEEALILLRYKKLLGYWLQEKPVKKVETIDLETIQEMNDSWLKKTNKGKETKTQEEQTSLNEEVVGMAEELEEDERDNETPREGSYQIGDAGDVSRREMQKMEATIKENNVEIIRLRQELEEMHTSNQFKEERQQKSVRRNKSILKFVLMFVVLVQGFFPNRITPIFLVIECFLQAFFRFSISMFIYETMNQEKLRFLAAVIVLLFINFHFTGVYDGSIIWIVGYYALNAILLLSLLTSGPFKIFQGGA